jgi:hypothetical protein
MNKELDEAAETYAEDIPFDVKPAFKAGAAWAFEFINAEMDTRARSHGPKPVAWIKFNCAVCGKAREEQPATYRRRIKRSSTGKLFCSTLCSRRDQLKRAKLKAA